MVTKFNSRKTYIFDLKKFLDYTGADGESSIKIGWPVDCDQKEVVVENEESGVIDIYRINPMWCIEKEGTNVLKYFKYGHLPENLAKTSKPIAELAKEMDKALPQCEEKDAGMRKLLEAKDCFVRATLEKKNG